jgi:hypothetical protein
MKVSAKPKAASIGIRLRRRCFVGGLKAAYRTNNAAKRRIQKIKAGFRDGVVTSLL